MEKHNTTPLEFPRSLRVDNWSGLTTGRAGETIPVHYAPLLRGDSATGRVMMDVELSEMPKPLENAVVGRAQTWFTPKSALPQFASKNEFVNSWHGQDVKQLGSTNRTPRALFDTVGTGAIAALQASEIFRALGVSCIASTAVNTDIQDTYVHIYNFRLSAHTSKGTRADYYSENATTSLQLKPAFWPKSRMANVVPDYEQALVTGSLELDVIAGSITLSGNLPLPFGFYGSAGSDANTTSTQLGNNGSNSPRPSYKIEGDSTSTGTGEAHLAVLTDGSNTPLLAALSGAGDQSLAGQSIGVTLADIDKARETNVFAKAVARMDGNDFSGFNAADVGILELMSGFPVEEDMYSRPWLLDSKTGVFGMTERNATDAANLDDSVTVGRLSLSLSINVPASDTGGIIMTLFEFMPERLYPRMADPFLEITTKDQFPDALRDSLAKEPTEIVRNADVDSGHTTPTGTYGFRELNGKWNREFTRMGGDFRSLTPGSNATAARTAIWQPLLVDPALTITHWQCPHPFPQDVFSAPGNDTATISTVANITIRGLTQFGTQLVEDNGDYAGVISEASS